ncbi:MAG: glycerol-3-phosphate acyltransferase [Ignavibacteriales bacterium]|nr:glycerol-3-phosphate acyltransferase [Ignavibacteriales bacterium]
MMVMNVIFPFLAYGVGCFNAGYYFVHWKTGNDIRLTGSGTTGATNVGRVAGWKGFAITTVIDLFKGVIVMWSAREIGIGDLSLHCSLIAVVGGHIWPLQLGFRGGKGVNTAIGALLMVQPGLCVLSLLVFSLFFFVTKDYLLNGLLAFFLMPVVGLVMGLPLLTILTLVILVAILIFSQRGNIKEHIRVIRSRSVKTKQ